MKNGHRGLLRLEGGLLLAGVLLLSVCVYLLMTLDQRVTATEKIEKREFNQEYARFADLMAEVFLEVQDKYVEPIEPEKLFESALNGMFLALDPHSGYLDADNFKELEKSTEGEYAGIGIHIDLRDGVLTVISPIPGSPAARLGIRPWDRIIKIEGKSTEGMTTTDAVKQLTGPVGTRVNITIFRESEKKQIPFTIIRDRIKIESIYSNADAAPYVTPYFQYLLKNKIGYARITKFSEQATEDLVKAIDRMKDAGVEGLILDVRFNSGGLLDQAIDVSNLFLEKGNVIVATKGRLSDQNKVYRAGKDKMVDWPVILLINQASASASEILAGALKDHKRGILVGPKGKNTYGKGSVQTISPLRVSLEKDKDGNYLPNALRLTTAKYYTPANVDAEGKAVRLDGKSIHGIGIEPDITVEIPDAHETDLLTKGWLLGEPVFNREGEAEEGKDKSDEMGKQKGTPTPTPEPAPTQAPSPNPSSSQENGANKDEGAKPGQDKSDSEPGEPFYLENKHKNDVPTTEDIQLKYAVDLLRALLIVK